MAVRTLLESQTTAIELGDSIAASYCGRLLARLGARVIKVEQPQGSPLRGIGPFVPGPSGRKVSATYESLNAGKEVVSLDVDAAADRGRVEQLLAEHGDLVLLSGRAADWADRGLALDRISARAPDAIVGRVTMFGEEGPYTNLVGGELQAQALGGLMNMVGDPNREPLRIGGYQAQRSTGLAMLTGFALAMFHRLTTGSGSTFAVSVLETVSHIEWKGALLHQANGSVVTRGSSGSPAILKARDGFFAFFYRPDDWDKVVAIMGDPRLAQERFKTKTGRDTHRAALLSVLNDCAGKWSKRELYHRTQAARMTTGYMATMGDLLESPQYLARDLFEKVNVGEGGVGRLPGGPWDVATGPSR